LNNNSGNNKKGRFEKEALTHIDSQYNLSSYLTKNSDDAKDLVQETYYKAYKFFHQFQEGTSIKAWLFKILKNTFINLYRKKFIEHEIIDYEKVESFIGLIKDDNFDFAHLEEDNLLNKFLSDDVVSALNQLPDDFKIVVLLSDVEGLSYKEIADIMECPIGTIRSRLSRARKMLQKILLNYALKQGIIKGKEK